MSGRMDVTGARPRLSYEVRVATNADAAAIRRFNQRLRAGGAAHGLPARGALPYELHQRGSGIPMFRELLIAADPEEVRAGVLLYHDAIAIRGIEQPFCWLQLPVSEGIVERRHSVAIVVLLAHVLERERLLMALGVGSLDEAYAKVLLELGWRWARIPFAFHAVRPSRVLAGLTYLRTRPRIRAAADVLARSGAGAVAEQALRAARGYQRLRLREFELQVVPEFGSWADRVYRDAAPEYGAAVTRDAATLNARYPPDDLRYTRLRLRRRNSGEECGWLVVVDAQMRGNKYFGDLHVGTLVDGFGPCRYVSRLVGAGLNHLATKGVDLVVANWSHEAWVGASRRTGCLLGPSNYFVFVSPQGHPLLEAALPLGAMHLTRGDGDGPGQLLPSPTRGSTPPPPSTA
ncbi:MAG TPA: hypothetical protein VFS33_06080 [Gemmatimonadales bacterium]|nr:hypothetical protein [Gemmatimonadales bacterium]